MSKRTCVLTLVAAGLIAGCATAKLHPYELDEAMIGAPGVKTLLLLPLNLLVALPPELDGATERVTKHIRNHLDACGVQTRALDPGEARELWDEVAEPGLEQLDAAERVGRYVRHLRSQYAFDALIVPSLVYRDGRIRAVTNHVDWDGVRRTLKVSGYVHSLGSELVVAELRGEMPGVSLHLAVYQPDGTLVFDSFGGLDLVHEAEYSPPARTNLSHRNPMPTYAWRLMHTRLSDDAALREGVAMAFTPWLDAPGLPPPQASNP